jgi:hypothetical protein
MRVAVAFFLPVALVVAHSGVWTIAVDGVTCVDMLREALYQIC